MKIKTREITTAQMNLFNMKGYMSNFDVTTKSNMLQTAFKYYWWDFVDSDPVLVKTLYKYDIDKNIRTKIVCDRIAEGWRGYTSLEDEFLDIIMNICEYDIKALHCKEIAYKHFMED